SVSLPDSTVENGTVNIPLNVGDLTGQGVISYQFTVTYDSNIVNALGIVTDGSISSGMTVIPNTNNAGEIAVGAFGFNPLSGSGVLVYLQFEIVADEGTTPLEFNDTFMFNAGTPAATTTDGSITIPGNTPPEFNKVMPDTTVDEGDLLSFQYTGSDADGDTVTFDWSSAPAGLTVSESGLLNWQTDYTDEGSHEIIVVLTDGEAIVYDTANVTVNDVNRPPEFVNVLPDTTVTGGDTLEYHYTGTDPDGDALTFSIVSGPDGVVITSDGQFSWTTDFNLSDTSGLVVSLSDGQYTVYDSADVTVVPKIFEVSISEIQLPTDTTDASPYADLIVRTTGIVTAVSFQGYGYYIQDGAGAWNGLWVYDRTNTPVMGDDVTVEGLIIEYYGFTEMHWEDQKVGFTTNSTGNSLPDAEMINTGDLGEEYESVLVQFDSAEVTNPDLGNGEWEVDDGSGPTRIDDYLFAYSPNLGDIYNITGIGRYSFGTFRIDPRDISDIQRVYDAEDLVKLWNFSTIDGTIPDYFGSSTERGAAYGFVNGKNRFYVVSRTGEPKIQIHDAKTGNFFQHILGPYQPVGFFPLNVVDVSDDGVIFVANGVPFGMSEETQFTVYRYDIDHWIAPVPIVVAEYWESPGVRMGDMFSVYGSTEDNSIKMYAAINGDNRIIKFSTSDNGYSFTSEVITLSQGALGTNPNVAQDGVHENLWVKSYGEPLRHYLSDGTYNGEVSVEVVGTGGSKIYYFEFQGEEYVVVYYPDVPGNGDQERVDVVNVTSGPAQAYVAYQTESFGNVQNSNGAGSVDVLVSEDGNDFTVFVEGANNGIAAYSTNSEFVFPAEYGPKPESLMSLEHTPGDLTVTVYNNGRIGQLSQLPSDGITWKEQDGIYRAAPLFGRVWKGSANGAAHQNEIDFADLVNIESNFESGFTSDENFDQISYALFNDGLATPEPYYLPTIQYTMSKNGENFVLLRYGFL
ncbi:cohesin domain-containing protein, partial [Bacteroidota bacterium]